MRFLANAKRRLFAIGTGTWIAFWWLTPDTAPLFSKVTGFLRKVVNATTGLRLAPPRDLSEAASDMACDAWAL
jgi:hypothetical protein